jgi:peroxiredoxin Q/BCP
MSAEIGDIAPDFSLPDPDNQQYSLSQFKGKNHVVLSFHIFNFTPG